MKPILSERRRGLRFAGITASRRVLVLLAMASLMGCVSRPEFEFTLEHWIGQRETALVSVWGPPDRFHELEGRRFLTYAEGNRKTRIAARQAGLKWTSGNTPPTGPGPSPASVGSPPSRVPAPPPPFGSSCTVTFTVIDGVVQSWGYYGTACYSQF